MSSSDIYQHETELADWVEMLMRWMQQTPYGYETVWDAFKTKTRHLSAADMEQWLEARHDYCIAEDDPEDRAGSPRDE